MSIALKFARLTRRRVLTWTRGYLSNNDVGYTNKPGFFLELSDLSDNPKVLDKIANQFLQLQAYLFEGKLKAILSLMESKNKELESKNKELESKDKKILSLVKSKNKDYFEELLSLTNEFYEGALELIRSQRGFTQQILSKDMSIVFTEPVDNALMRLSQDEDFIKILKKACENNGLRYDDVQNCIRGLYHSASKQFYGREPQIVIDSRSWSSNEVFVLGIIFDHFKIPFDYRNRDEL
ncbi:25658_t:CDS:2 [Dentiscutata erythropus]|uniref:25658_t:CDS:1 n=1 Tax=Dentiscutata erythropus TaxID=1348616 RepID=A0A9N9CUH3_9GLOM|nr:25658_t:CDS:2 [Dentiscutata erythropus]